MGAQGNFSIIMTIVLIVFTLVLSWIGIVNVTKKYKRLSAKVLLYFMLGCAIISSIPAVTHFCRLPVRGDELCLKGII